MDRWQMQLLNWYAQHKRQLPWRDSRNPYHIWLSEIILQQTRIDQGLAYYLKFVDKYPTVNDLANASEQDVLKLWQGLGYYSRARNLLTAARQIVNDFDGHFPQSFAALKKLKGVGDYTAAAVASIAFNMPNAAVDGNVYRLLSRLYAIDVPINTQKGKKIFSDLANSLIQNHQPGIYNQAVMEFGALYCKPSKPDCQLCVIKEHCMAFAQNKVDQLPVKLKTINVKRRFFHYIVFLFRLDGICHTLMKKRPENDIWQGLYDFPLIETTDEVDTATIAQIISNNFGLKQTEVKIMAVSEIFRHQLTHQHIRAQFYQVYIPNSASIIQDNSLSLTPKTTLDQYPLPRLIDKYLAENEKLDCNNN